MNIRCYFRVPFVVKSVFIRGFLKKQLFSAYFFLPRMHTNFYTNEITRIFL
jgi:hypothetical protein